MSNGYGVGIRVVDTGGGIWPNGGGGSGGAGTSKSGGSAGTSVILGGPLLLIRVDSGLSGRPIGDTVLVAPLPFSSLTIPVMISWISGLACRACPGWDDEVAKLGVIVAVGLISWGSDSGIDLACGAPCASPERNIPTVSMLWLIVSSLTVFDGSMNCNILPDSSTSLESRLSATFLYDGRSSKEDAVLDKIGLAERTARLWVEIESVLSLGDILVCGVALDTIWF